MKYHKLVNKQFKKTVRLSESFDEKSVHQFRVQLRTLRTLLSFIEYDSSISKKLRKIHREYSFLRDLDVLINRWQQIKQPNQIQLLTHLLNLREQEAHKLQQLNIKAKINKVWQSIDQEIIISDDYIDKKMNSWKKKLKKLDGDTYEELHRHRILSKKMRFMIQQLNLKDYDLKKYKKRQEQLGALVDNHVGLNILNSIEIDHPELSDEINTFRKYLN